MAMKELHHRALPEVGKGDAMKKRRLELSTTYRSFDDHRQDHHERASPAFHLQTTLMECMVSVFPRRALPGVGNLDFFGPYQLFIMLPITFLTQNFDNNNESSRIGKVDEALSMTMHSIKVGKEDGAPPFDGHERLAILAILGVEVDLKQRVLV
uniref:Uncharacterized protein n=1 Tax=Nelumbo nucifera TaxID=4432 RepID=A0A822XWJ0_NELNU|nr:TPA_asm: hypothetical protein HUJ06_024598 [Nelumbo nucifera]